MRRLAGLIMSGLGSFLVILAAAEFLVVGGQAAKYPLNEYQVTTSVGRNVSYFSAAVLKEFSGVKLRVSRTIEGDVAAGSSARGVWDEFSYAYDETDAMPYPAYQPSTERLAFDRRTGVVLNCCGAAVGSTQAAGWAGQGFGWPAGTRERTYLVFDPTLLQPEPARYAGTASLDGMTTLKFAEQVPVTRFGSQTLPGALVGLKDQASVTLGEYYQTTTTSWVDPVTGQVVDTAQDEQLSLRSGAGDQPLELFGGSIRMQSPSVAALVRSARRRDRLVRLATTTGPVAALLAGIILLAVGSVLALARTAGGEAAADEQPHAVATHGDLAQRAR
jgi:hypothetical protein